MEQQNNRKAPESNFGGLYKNVRISVSTLDKVIVGGIALMIALVIFGIANNGYTVQFDSNGGSDVPLQADMMYGDLLEEPEAPTREGYNFTGWYLDENCRYLWDFESTQVSQSMTLYAGWEAKTE